MDERFKIKITGAVAKVFEYVLQTYVVRLSGPQAQVAPAPSWLSCVDVGEGALRVSMTFSDRLATQVAATMFAIAPAKVNAADIEDAIGELCCMVSGGVKRLAVPGGQMGLPDVLRCSGEGLLNDDAQVLCELPFLVETELLLVTIERDKYADVAA